MHLEQTRPARFSLAHNVTDLRPGDISRMGAGWLVHKDARLVSENASACQNCCHFDGLPEDGERKAGFCRRFALPPSFDGWAITEAHDWCESWQAR